MLIGGTTIAIIAAGCLLAVVLAYAAGKRNAHSRQASWDAVLSQPKAVGTREVSDTDAAHTSPAPDEITANTLPLVAPSSESISDVLPAGSVTSDAARPAGTSGVTLNSSTAFRVPAEPEDWNDDDLDLIDSRAEEQEILRQAVPLLDSHKTADESWFADADAKREDKRQPDSTTSATSNIPQQTDAPDTNQPSELRGGDIRHAGGQEVPRSVAPSKSEIRSDDSFVSEPDVSPTREDRDVDRRSTLKLRQPLSATRRRRGIARTVPVNQPPKRPTFSTEPSVYTHSETAWSSQDIDDNDDVEDVPSTTSDLASEPSTISDVDSHEGDNNPRLFSGVEDYDFEPGFDLFDALPDDFSFDPTDEDDQEDLFEVDTGGSSLDLHGKASRLAAQTIENTGKDDDALWPVLVDIFTHSPWPRTRQSVEVILNAGGNHATLELAAAIRRVWAAHPEFAQSAPAATSRGERWMWSEATLSQLSWPRAARLAESWDSYPDAEEIESLLEELCERWSSRDELRRVFPSFQLYLGYATGDLAGTVRDLPEFSFDADDESEDVFDRIQSSHSWPAFRDSLHIEYGINLPVATSTRPLFPAITHESDR